MPAEIIPLRPTFDPARVELSSPGTQFGLPFYLVDIVEADGGRACMWAGTDRVEALVVQLTARGFRHVVTSEGSPYGW